MLCLNFWLYPPQQNSNYALELSYAHENKKCFTLNFSDLIKIKYLKYTI